MVTRAGIALVGMVWPLGTENEQQCQPPRRRREQRNQAATCRLVRLQPQARIPGNAAKHPAASTDNLRALAQAQETCLVAAHNPAQQAGLNTRLAKSFSVQT